jgi:hypothetical protein
VLYDGVYETLLKVAYRYNLQLKYSHDTERYNHYLIEEERSEFLPFFVEIIHRNRLYVDVRFNCICFEIYSNYKRLCRVEIHEEIKVRNVLKYIARHDKDYRNYRDFLYNLVIYLKKKG